MCLLVHSPVGSNIERYGVLLGAPLLVCALARDGAGARRYRSSAGSRWRRSAPGCCGARCAKPRRSTARPPTSASYYQPVERFLDGIGGGRSRVEVPLTRSHWEAAMLAPHVALARGWEKQLDSRYDGVLLEETALGRSAYRDWLDREAISYVALPDVAARPVERGRGPADPLGPSLPARRSSRTPHWRVFAVQGAAPLATGPGRLTELGHDTFALDALERAGTFLVRVHFTRYWTVRAGRRVRRARAAKGSPGAGAGAGPHRPSARASRSRRALGSARCRSCGAPAG